MKILAIEFSSARRSVAVADAVEVDEEGRRAHGVSKQPSAETAVDRPQVLSEATADSGGLGPFRLIQRALAEAGTDREAIERLVVGLGPGSYTGIRSALAVAQGWQMARAIQLAGVSSAEATALTWWASGGASRCTVIVDAQRGEFYLGVYERGEDGLAVEPIRLAQAEEIRERLARGEKVIGPEADVHFAGATACFPKASAVARLGIPPCHTQAGECLEPIYLRQTSFKRRCAQ